MTFISVAQTNPKTAEFARLFDLFDRVATRRTRTLSREVISEDDIANVPAEFAPVLRNLHTVLSFRARRDEEHARRAPPAPTTKPRHSTFSKKPLSLKSVEQDAESWAFPLGERYPFTFKLMLHKLYDMDEWAEKVKAVVETSKSRFKPLSERDQNFPRNPTKRNSMHPTLGASAKFKPPSTTMQSQSVALSRDGTGTTSTKERRERRTSVRPVLGASAKFRPPRPPSAARHPHASTIPTSKPEASRVVKKRCIGRRKSVNGPMSTGVWVYEAAISATEVAGARRAVEITLSTPTWWHAHAGGLDEGRTRRRSLATLQELRTRDSARRKVKITVPVLQGGDQSTVPPPRSSVSFSESTQEVVESMQKKKRSAASVFAIGPCQGSAVKRPLCV